ncbi:hypothetical protein [Escherichia phage vB_EcoS_SCS92]|uniref:hypothetical protein n=1 Tax=Escherichia phage NTEC3 TaxID=2885687 RepID=UPI001E7ECD3B|nr:hypothetical protein QCF73_gp18 [Escherichia phage NTEC3]UDG73257.1 hypothetical protein [Escherichia phage NTEC3]UTQ72447.1 hypothetical protein [Escherichia phage vB_EcoS_SCS92]
MPEITISSLERRILVLESEKQTLGGQLSINGEFQLEAFKLLLTLTADIENMIGLLQSGEWAEHCTKSALGKRLETEITDMLSCLVEAPDEHA